jgi:tetratricopeptide (TPR) repeat protein
MEAEQSSFAYIFIHRFLPIIKIFSAITLVALSLAYLTWQFIITPIQAEKLYKEGYAILHTGEYTRANDLFSQGFEKRRVKNWFYRYAEGFRDERQYIFAERKYDELLRVYPRDKKGALNYAAMETNWLKNYEKADRILRNNILDHAVNDREGLYALAENNLAWGAIDPSRYDDARAAYARLMEIYGRKDIYLEGMLKYFIRTDMLSEVLPIHAYFMKNPKKRKISVPALAELGAYLLDKRFEASEGVPDEYADRIEGIRDVLLRAIKEDGKYPEPYYHLARYYHHYGSVFEERQSLKDAIRAFSNAPEESSQRASFRIDAHRRLAEIMINVKEFFPAEEELLQAKRLYEDALSRQVVKTNAMFGRIYSDLGDLEYFVKDGDMEAALRLYLQGEQNLWAPPEIQYRMGAAHYQLGQWEDALLRFFPLVSAMPGNRRLLYAMGNVSYQRGNYFAAQGYYNRLMDMLDAQRLRFPNLTPGSRPEEQDLTERIMVSENNLGVTLETLTRISGDTSYRSRALGLFADSIRAWDVLTRDPEAMTRMRPLVDLYAPGINLAFLNVRAITLSEPNYDPQIYMRIDRDSLEPSPWEDLITRDYQLSDQSLPLAVE